MKILDMTKEDFNKVPKYDGTNFDFKDFRSLVIIPTGELHESGWGCMEYCLVDKEEEPLIRIAGGSDVLCLDGIGGYGDWDPKIGIPKSVESKGWQIDCLPCGYVRLFPNCKLYFRKEFFFGSTVEVYGRARKEK